VNLESILTPDFLLLRAMPALALALALIATNIGVINKRREERARGKVPSPSR
jgi:hypothetical protein